MFNKCTVIIAIIVMLFFESNTSYATSSPQVEMVKKVMPAVVGIGVDKRGFVGYRLSGGDSFWDEFKKQYEREEKQFRQKSKPQWDERKDSITADDIQVVGSGFVIDREGRVLTNSHVVEGERRVFVSMHDGRIFKASVLKESPKDEDDVAVLQMENAPIDLTVAKLGDSNNVDIAEPVIAIGNPFIFAFTVTSGIISAVRDMPEGKRIQIDAAINPGNSGGPLINMNGEVIGINQMIMTDPAKRNGEGNVFIGIAFAVPINRAKALLASSGRQQGQVQIGIQLKQTKGGEVVIVHVEDNSPGQKAGLREGDVIIALDGQGVSTPDWFVKYIRGKKTSDVVTLRIERNGKKMKVDVQLAGKEG